MNVEKKVKIALTATGLLVAGVVGQHFDVLGTVLAKADMKSKDTTSATGQPSYLNEGELRAVMPAQSNAPLGEALKAPAEAPAKAPAATVTATVTPRPVDTATATPAVLSTGSMPPFVEDISHGAWKIRGTERLSQNPIVKGWLQRIRDVAPRLWRTFPNIPNPDVPDFRVVNGKQVPDGMEYGTYNTPYMWSKPGDIPVGARGYRFVSGDYNFLGTECKGDKKKGCMLLVENVMDQSVTFRDQYVDNGFTLSGRYFNGDTLEMGTWGLISHGAANMLNMPTLAREGEVLNSGDPGNSGANCGVPEGCKTVDVQLVVTAGDAIIAQGRTIVSKDESIKPAAPTSTPVRGGK